jgi:hypothetical protein
MWVNKRATKEGLERKGAASADDLGQTAKSHLLLGGTAFLAYPPSSNHLHLIGYDLPGGKLGAASVVRRVEVSAVDATALVAQMEDHTGARPSPASLGRPPVSDISAARKVGWRFAQPIPA